VRLFGGEDGMATLSTTLAGPVGAACYRALEAYADACQVPGDERTKDQRMTDCLVDLLLGTTAAADGRPAVHVQLTVVAPADTLTGTGDEPGEIDGQPVPALLVREVAYALGLLPRAEPVPSEGQRPEPAQPDETSTDPTPPDPTPPDPTPPDDARGVEIAMRSMSRSEQAAADLAALLDIPTTAGTALAALPTVAVVEEVSGQLLALTDAREIRRTATCGRRPCRSGRRACTHPPTGAGLGPPPATDRYTPSAPLDRFVRVHDRRCRFPGCRARAQRCDLDHNVPWPDGATSASNLCCLCRHHHRLSHQAPGWSMHRLPNGGVEWTTPGGDRLVTHPIPYGTDDLPPPNVPPMRNDPSMRSHPSMQNDPAPPTTNRPMTVLELLRAYPCPPDPDEDPAPF
jgi:hypothetical protein